jgi:amino-acid N-acetyltransferase
MHKLINSFAERGQMLPRPLSEIYENIRDYFVARDDGVVVGCAALHVNWSDLAEVRSLRRRRHRRHVGLTSLRRASAGRENRVSICCLQTGLL